MAARLAADKENPGIFYGRRVVYELVKSGSVKTGSMVGSRPASFDAKFLRPDAAAAKNRQEWRLEVILKIYLKQRNPDVWPPLASDLDDTPFFIERWTHEEWELFKRGAEKQARLWDRKFWLKPPWTFTEGDITHEHGPASVWRPYIDCLFMFRFEANPKDTHRTIEVAKLNIDYAKGVAMKDLQDYADGGTFRSNAVLWDSFDLTPTLSISLNLDNSASRIPPADDCA